MMIAFIKLLFNENSKYFFYFHMVVLTINLSLLLLKILAFSWFTSDRIFLKIILIFLLLIFLWYCYKHPKPLENDLFVIIDYYKVMQMHAGTSTSSSESVLTSNIMDATLGRSRTPGARGWLGSSGTKHANPPDSIRVNAGDNSS